MGFRDWKGRKRGDDKEGDEEEERKRPPLRDTIHYGNSGSMVRRKLAAD